MNITMEDREFDNEHYCPACGNSVLIPGFCADCENEEEE